MIDFGALPPEINSARMHFGLGSATLESSAAAWQMLAAELGSSAAAFNAVTMALAAGPWTGPSSMTMVAASAPYVLWVMACAVQCEQAGIAATQAALAYEAARMGHIHPTIIAENRTELMTLIATNFLGINTPAIAANEAEYSEFWAQDASAMYGYAADGSAITASMVPFMPPTPTTDPAGLAAQASSVGDAANQPAGQAASQAASAAMSAGPSLMSAIPGALQGLSSPVSGATQQLSSLMSSLGGGGFANDMAGRANFPGVFSALTRMPGGVGGMPASVSASMGRAGSVGGLSVPPRFEAMRTNWVSENTGVARPLVAETMNAPLMASDEEETGSKAAPRMMMPALATGSGGDTTPAAKRSKVLRRMRPADSLVF
jgi:PPE-repeat protein